MQIIRSSSVPGTSYTTATPAFSKTQTPACPDRVETCTKDDVHLLFGQPQYATVPLCAKEASTPEGRSAIAERLIADMKAYPSLTAVIGMLNAPDGNTHLVVASRDGAIESSEVGGVYRVIRDLSSSPTLKAQAAQNQQAFTPAAQFDAKGLTYDIRLPGTTSEATLAKELAEGGKPNQTDMLKDRIESLPKDRPVVILMAGPSAAGKSTLAEQIKQYAGDRPVADLTADMYYRDADDAALPKTPSGSIYWDNIQAMHWDEFIGTVVKLAKDGKANIPDYDFGASVPGTTAKGKRTDKVTPITMDPKGILVIDSLFAANSGLIDALKANGLSHATVYLDSQRAEDRLARRMVRDYDTRGRDAHQTLSDWDSTTFPGEVHFVRPTMLQMDPANDVALVNKFPNDPGMTREQLDHKVEVLDKYGLGPSYPALKTSDEGMSAFAVSEEKRLRDVVADPKTSDANRAKAQAAADRIAAARGGVPAAH